MRVLVAGATGAVGRPLVDELLAAGHEVAALTRRKSAAQELRARGAEPFSADVFDAHSVIDACSAAKPEVVIGELTALPAKPDIRHYVRDLEPTNRLRAEATPNLIAGARAAGARRLVVQSISFLTAPEGPPVGDESARPYDDAPPALRPAIAATIGMERTVLDARDVDPIVLRYGFFYGPGNVLRRGRLHDRRGAPATLPDRRPGNGHLVLLPRARRRTRDRHRARRRHERRLQRDRRRARRDARLAAVHRRVGRRPAPAARSGVARPPRGRPAPRLLRHVDARQLERPLQDDVRLGAVAAVVA